MKCSNQLSYTGIMKPESGFEPPTSSFSDMSHESMFFIYLHEIFIPQSVTISGSLTVDSIETDRVTATSSNNKGNKM